MCPIYKFTRDEAAAPKAKANILRYLISGEILIKVFLKNLFNTLLIIALIVGVAIMNAHQM